MSRKLNRGATEAEVQRYEKKLGVDLPREFRELLLYSNGMSLFGQHIMGMDEQTLFAPEGILSFHNWGNGDFDCVAVSARNYPRGSVVFMNHTPEITVKVEDSLLRWLEKIVDEIRTMGTLLHPTDYKERSWDGVYRQVLYDLRNVDCELNR